MSEISINPPDQDLATDPRAQNRRRLLIALAALFVFSLSLWQNMDAVDESQFHPDESRWLNRAYYLRELIHPTSKVWEDRYLTRGQPPMGSIVTGIGLLVQGRSLDQNGPWDFHYGNEVVITWNLVKGNMPNPADLIAARRTSAVVGAITCLALFFIVTSLVNWVGGLVAATFLAFHPLQVYLASIAVSDAVFTMFIAVSTLLAIELAKKPTWGRAILLGFLLGVGASTKLSPLFVAGALAAGGSALVLGDFLRTVPGISRLWSFISHESVERNRRLGWMLITLPATAVATFVLSYPYLWPDPIGRTRYLLDFRTNEMENQAKIWPSTAVDSRIEGFRRTWQNLENQYSTTGRAISAIGKLFDRDWSGMGFDVPIALIGLALFAWLTLRRGVASQHMLALGVLTIQSSIILFKLRVDFNRYYLPLVFVCALGIGVLAGQIWAVAAPRLIGRPSAVSVKRPIRSWIPARPRTANPVARQTTGADS